MPGRAATPVRYDTRTVYGPFHRLTKTREDPGGLPRLMLRAGELWGRGPRTSPIPAALAYFGPLPRGRSGLEFYSLVEPDQPYGPVVFWRVPPHGHARDEDPWAKIDVLMYRVSEGSL